MNSTYGQDHGHGHDLDFNYSYLPSVVSANVISIIGFGISILLLCTHLIVYSITEDMWTLTGNSLASFCFSLLLSYCAYIGAMVVHDTNSPCAIVALLAFYFFLANSSWLLSISLQLYKSRSANAAHPQPQRPRNNVDTGGPTSGWAFVRYSIFSWTEPALLLGVALYVERYGGGGGLSKMPKNLRVDMFPLETNCFNIDTRMLIWFLGFFNVNLLTAFVVSAFTAFAAHRNADENIGGGMVTTDGHFFTVLKYYMRLSLLAGFVWIVGMCMIYFKGHVLQIIFAVSNAALALYIFLVFTFNNKLSSVAFDGGKSYDMDTFRRHSFQYGHQSAVPTASAITSDV